MAHKSFLGGFIICTLAQILYLSSLTVLIPLGILIFLSPVQTTSMLGESLPWGSVVLLLLSVIILFGYYHNTAKTVSILGWLSLIPGLSGLFFLLVDRESLFNLLSSFLVGINVVEPVIAAWENTLPQLWLFVIGYLVLGMFLIHLAGRLGREHALVSKIKQMFGRRARIVRSH